MFRPTGLQGLDSLLYGRVGKNMEHVRPAMEQALSSTSNDYTLSRIRRCLDHLRGDSVDRVLVNLI
ncbi:MAG TPA: hypothetical protein VN620_19145 [Candidatus Methylomirabilis sp.]|nr:hypothetical protein [Candidatus Methylomirabilis sp.]